MKRKIEKNIHQSNVLERPKRKWIQIPAQLTVGDKKHAGFIINISDHGVKVYINTTFDESVIDCNRDTIVKLEMKPACGDIFTLQCKIKSMRIQESSADGLISSFGMEVIDPPHNFNILLQRLL